MKQIEIRILTGLDAETSLWLVSAMGNVPGDASTVMSFYDTITRLVEGREDLKDGLIASLLRMTLKAPILATKVLEYVKDNIQALECLSRKYLVDLSNLDDSVYATMIKAN
jgi:hypothetical protein